VARGTFDRINCGHCLSVQLGLSASLSVAPDKSASRTGSSYHPYRIHRPMAARRPVPHGGPGCIAFSRRKQGGTCRWAGVPASPTSHGRPCTCHLTATSSHPIGKRGALPPANLPDRPCPWHGRCSHALRFTAPPPGSTPDPAATPARLRYWSRYW
jgi:hypothetical protein